MPKFIKKKKSEIFSKENVRVVQAAVNQRFGDMSGIEIKESDGLFHVSEKNPKLERLHIPAEYSERQENGEKLSIISFSSETPVMHFGEPEILIHRKGSVDFSPLLTVGAILKNHDPDVIVGVPVKAWIDGEKRGVLSMRWGTTDDALKAKQEALIDKTLRGVSVGFNVQEWVYLRNKTESYKGISGPAWIAVKWSAREASLTPIPADPSVGYERTVRVCSSPRVVKINKEIRAMKLKKLKLLRAWEASEGKTHVIGAELEVDERTFDELTGGDDPQAEAVTDAPVVRAVEPIVPAPGTDPKPGVKPIDPEAIRQLARDEMLLITKAETKRGTDIRAMCKKFKLSDMAVDLIESNKSIDEARVEVLDKVSERQVAPIPGQVSLVKDGVDGFRSAATDGLLMRAFPDGAVKVDKPAPGANEFQGRSLLRLAEECLVRAGIRVPANVHEMVKLALRGAEAITGSTSDFPLILANTANKALLAGYEVAPATFQFWTRAGSLNDFKEATRLKFSEVGKLKLVLEGGKYTETKRTEKQETIQLGTYARMWTMSRQGIINDDLGAFTNTQFSFGMQARMLPNDLAIAILTANAAMTDGFALFSTQHGNISIETDRRIDTLAHATTALIYLMGLMAEQQTYQDATETARYLNLRPKVWLVSMTDEIIARQAVVSATDASQDNPGVVNPFKNLGIQIVGDQNIKTSSTDFSHYLFADPRLAPVVEVAFLQGNQRPYQEEINQTDADGRKWLVRLDCGASAVDSVGAAKEVGTDAE